MESHLEPPSWRKLHRTGIISSSVWGRGGGGLGSILNQVALAMTSGSGDVGCVHQATKLVLGRAVEGPETMTLFPSPFSSGVKESSGVTLFGDLFLLLWELPVTVQNCERLSLAKPLLRHLHL